jgi:hypothetical protein
MLYRRSPRPGWGRRPPSGSRRWSMQPRSSERRYSSRTRASAGSTCLSASRRVEQSKYNLFPSSIRPSRRRAQGWKRLSIEVRDAGGIEGVLKTATDARAGTPFVHTGGFLFPHARRISELAAGAGPLPCIDSDSVLRSAGCPSSSPRDSSGHQPRHGEAPRSDHPAVGAGVGR